MNYHGPRPNGLATFSINDGYPEAILRGYKLSLLTQNDYNNLSQCDVIEDIKVHLQPIYGDFLEGLPTPLTTGHIGERCIMKMAQEFEYLRCNSFPPLTTFLDYFRMAYMIDNVILLITGTINGRDPEELREKCHPLGVFDGIQSITVEHTLSDLYNTVLIDTPLAPYIQCCLSVEDLDELNIEIIRNTLYKAYLEDFHLFCNKLGGISGQIMNEILSFEADRRSINVTLNSFGTELQLDERVKLYPNFGLLYPQCLELFKHATDTEQVRSAVEIYPAYRSLFTSSEQYEEKTLEDMFFEFEAKNNRLALTHVSSYASFYAYFKLKEQEIRNIIWIAECILQSQKHRINQLIQVV